MRRNYKNIGINSTKNTHETVAGLIEKNHEEASVLDIPCGAGALSLRLKDRGFKVVPSDIVNDILQIDSDNFKQSNLNDRLPFDDNTFDLITCIDGIAHVENIPHTIREFQRVLKTGGSLIISTPNISSIRSRFRFLTTGFHNKRKIPLNEKRPNPEHLINIVDLPMLRYFLHTNSFKIISVVTNRIKPISWLYSIFVPISFFFTYSAFKTVKQDKSQSKINMDILGSLFKPGTLFGETLIVQAVKN